MHSLFSFIINIIILQILYLVKVEAKDPATAYTKIDSPLENIVWCGAKRVITNDETIEIED